VNITTPTSFAAVEAAIDQAIGESDWKTVLELAPEVARLRPVHRAIIDAKLLAGFGREYPRKEFRAAIQRAQEECA